MTKTLADLLRAAAEGVSALSRKLDSLGAMLTPALAAEAREFYLAAMRAGQFGAAQLGSFLAGILYARIGFTKDELLGGLDNLQMVFTQADTVEKYRRAHEHARRLAAEALNSNEKVWPFAPTSWLPTHRTLPLNYLSKMKSGF